MQSVILLKNGQQGMSFGYLKATYSLCNSDCDSIVRRSCGKLWRMPCDLLPVLLDVPSGTPEASLSGSRQTSGTKKSLSLAEHSGITQNGLLVRLPFQFHFLHLFICHRHCVRRLPRFAPIEVVFRMGEVSRAENVGTE